jgi:hypothetical protein
LAIGRGRAAALPSASPQRAPVPRLPDTAARHPIHAPVPAYERNFLPPLRRDRTIPGFPATQPTCQLQKEEDSRTGEKSAVLTWRSSGRLAPRPGRRACAPLLAGIGGVLRGGEADIRGGQEARRRCFFSFLFLHVFFQCRSIWRTFIYRH